MSNLLRNVPTADLAERALKVLADTEKPLYSAETTAALQKILTTMAATHAALGPAPDLDVLRDIALAILADHDAAATAA